jgi:hypothetical protein
MGLLRRFWRRLADRDDGPRAVDLLILTARNDALARRVERLEAENRALRAELDQTRGEG